MQSPTTIKEGLNLLALNLIDFVIRLTSRRFLGVILTIVIPALNSSMKWGIPDGIVAAIIGAIMTYIVADTLEQSQKITQGIG